MKISDIIKKIVIDYVEKNLFHKYGYYKKLSLIEFTPIELPLIDCFHSNDLIKFIKIGGSFGGDVHEAGILLSKIVQKETLEVTKMDITSINSVSVSKSKSSGYSFGSLYEFGKSIYEERGDKWDIEECLAHIKKRGDVLDIVYYNWDGRYKWVNADGSHHFAVAIYHAINGGFPVEVDVRQTIKSINKSIAEELLKKYALFVINERNAYEIRKFFNDDVASDFRVFDSCNTLLAISRANSNSKQIKALENIDNRYVLNLNDYLLDKIVEE